jgi:hypothetical protein
MHPFALRFRAKAAASMLMLLTLPSCERSERAAQVLLGGDAYSYWDANRGYSIAFARDGTCYEYSYNERGQRVHADYGDVILDHYDWHMAANQLQLEAGDYCRTFQVLRFTRTEMVLRASSEERGQQIVLTKVPE